MIKLSQHEYEIFQSAIRRAWECALRELPVTDGNAERVAHALMQGAVAALEAGEREEAPLANAALAQLSAEETELFALSARIHHPLSPTIH